VTLSTSKIAEARSVLAAINFDAERSNERSALVLLALADLPPAADWSDARVPLRGTTAIMDWVRDHYGVAWAPNTRETVRRRTLHQFAEAGLILQNPDDPSRPINSPKWCYQLSPQSAEVLRTVGTPAFEDAMKSYLADLPGLRALYAAARALDKIPVTLPDGRAMTLSAGGQNVLIKSMVEEFCPRFTPGGHVLYVGDAASKADGVYDRQSLEQLGVSLPDRGKMPDLIVYMPDRQWLVLLEAASSHGPVDAKRHGELKALFEESSAGLVFVSCFPSRTEMRKYLSEIAWETDVWCADSPDHLVHFNGERFLGPY
jgi:hypothetical protein